MRICNLFLRIKMNSTSHLCGAFFCGCSADFPAGKMLTGLKNNIMISDLLFEKTDTIK